MPDHVHFFSRRATVARPMAEWMQMWKSVSSRQLAAADFGLFAGAALRMAGDHLAPVNVLEDIGDHRRGSGTTVDLTADVAFVNSRERVSGLVGRQKSREPGCRALFVLGSPLRKE